MNNHLDHPGSCPDDPAPRQHRDQRPTRDAGVNLIEVLVTVVMMGIVVTAISTAMIVILRTAGPTESRIGESSDISFVQTWLPQDLSAATEIDKEPTTQPGGDELPGTNVVTLRRPVADGALGSYTTVSYRYVQAADGWRLIRYELTGSGAYIQNVIARELPDPPEGWTPDQPATHAVEVTARNQIILRPVGENVTVQFRSGNSFTTGGGGMSAENELPAGSAGGLVDPAAPPSRCGRTITLVLDTSGSVPIQFGGEPLKTAAVGFIDAFTGTPSRVSVLGFDRSAYAMYPTTPGQYVGLLNTSAELSAARARILALDNLDGNWPGGGAAQHRIDPNGDGFHWDQIGSGTNWEDGLFRAFRTTPAGSLHNQLPELVVFITDGAPTRGRNADGTPTGEISSNLARDRAVAVAGAGRDTGARVIGVIVGRAANETGPTNNLRAVVGNVAWNGTGPDNVGNAAAADYFAGGFSDLGAVLRSIVVAECGGTVTVQKRIDTGGSLDDATGVWSFTTETGVRDLDRSREAAITFDYVFATGETTKTVQITETPKDGFVFSRAECSSNGLPLDPARMSAPAEGVPGVVLELSPDQAVSCLMISSPA